MWTSTTRRRHSRAGLRYASDLTDAEWRPLEPWLAPGHVGSADAGPGRSASPFTPFSAFCAPAVPGARCRRAFPPWRTVYRWFALLRDGGVFRSLKHHLFMHDGGRTGREPSPSAAVIDSQSVKTTESGGLRGYDAGKKSKMLNADESWLGFAKKIYPRF